MNKLFLTIALSAFFGAIVGSAVELATGDEEFSMMSVIPSDAQEVAHLTGDKLAFTDYCIQSRDEIKNFMRSSANGAAAGVFEALFTQVKEVATDLLDAESGALKEGAQLIQDHAVAQPSAASPQVKENLEENIQQLSLIQTVSNAVKIVVNAVIETARSAVFERFAQLRAQFNGENLKEKLTDACASISMDLTRKLETKLTATKSEMRAAVGKPGAPSADTIKNAKFDNIGCLTTGRVGKIVKFCDFLRVAGPTVFPLLGM